MKNKKLFTLIIACLLTLGQLTTAYASWVQNASKWYYYDANGVMATNRWEGNYYLGSDGAMLTNTTTPDGYQVGADGAWISSTSTGWQQDARCNPPR